MMDPNERILAMLPRAVFPGSVYMGRNSLMYLRTLKKEKTLVLASPTALGKHERLSQALSGFRTVKHSGEPSKSDLGKLVSGLDGVDTIVGAGGGSVMDLAKAACLEREIKLVLVPTTAGTGSEVSRHAVLLNEGNQKEPQTDDRLVPDVVLLDPSFLTSLPPFETFYTTMDSLAHALEGLVSRMANPLTDTLALKSIDMIIPSLEKSMDDPDNIEHRESLQVAGFLAGLVASSASVGLVHSFAHYFGPRLSLPHGVAVAMFLREVLRLNMGNTDKYTKLDGSVYLKKDNIMESLDRLFGKAGFDGRLDKQEFPETLLEEASEGVRTDVCTRTNPFMPGLDAIGEIVRRLPNVKYR